MSRPFTLERLDDLLRRYPKAFWRHDVDFSLNAALKMAEFEAEDGIFSTFYLFQVENHCPFYSWWDARRMKIQLEKLGHSVGVHIDERKITLEWDKFYEFMNDRPLVSFHCPSEKVLWRRFNTFKSAYEPYWKDRYLADSTGKFRFGDPEDVIPRDSDGAGWQINLHPEWWFEPDWEDNVIPDLYDAFFTHSDS